MIFKIFSVRRSYESDLEQCFSNFLVHLNHLGMLK